MKPRFSRQTLMATAALVPMALVVVVVYIGCTLWTVRISFTSSRSMPNSDFIGFRQYERLLDNTRWETSADNLLLFGALFVLLSLAVGLLLAILIDQNVKGEGAFRTLFLYPYSTSFVVTGLVWQWFLNPTLGLQKIARDLGFESFQFDWLVNGDRVIFALLIAAVWHAAGLVMAIMLAGLRGIDAEIWKAARVDGIPAWRVYLSIVLPMMGASVATAGVLLTISVFRLYDLVVAMTNGGPGIASEVPAKFVLDHLFDRQNIGLATAGSTMMLVSVLAVVVPYLYVREMRSRRAGVA